MLFNRLPLWILMSYLPHYRVSQADPAGWPEASQLAMAWKCLQT